MSVNFNGSWLRNNVGLQYICIHMQGSNDPPHTGEVPCGSSGSRPPVPHGGGRGQSTNPLPPKNVVAAAPSAPGRPKCARCINAPNVGKPRIKAGCEAKLCTDCNKYYCNPLPTSLAEGPRRATNSCTSGPLLGCYDDHINMGQCPPTNAKVLGCEVIFQSPFPLIVLHHKQIFYCFECYSIIYIYLNLP